MKFVVLLVDYVDDVNWNDLSEEEQATWMLEHQRFDEAVGSREGCRIVAGEALADDPFVFAKRDGLPAVTEGPFAEGTELIGGFYLIEAPDRDTLVELLAVLPAYVMEIRSVDTSVE